MRKNVTEPSAKVQYSKKQEILENVFKNNTFNIEFLPNFVKFHLVHLIPLDL